MSKVRAVGWISVSWWPWRPLQDSVTCVGQTETPQAVIPGWIVSYGSVIMPKPPTSDNKTQLPSLASLVWEPPADQHFLASCLSVSQRSPLMPGASPLPCSPTSKSPAVTQGLCGTDGALLVGSCCLSHARPRDKLENRCGRNLLSQQRLGERDTLSVWTLSPSPTSLEGFWLVCKEHGSGWRVSVGGKSHVPGSQLAQTALLVEFLEKREAVSRKEKTRGL